MDVRNFICIVCPQGCSLELTIDNDEYTCEGNRCKRGKEYAINECTNPKRMITTTVKIKNATQDVLPVISTDSIPKKNLREALDLLYSMEIEAPIKMGDVIVKNILDTNVDIVAARNLNIEERIRVC